MPYTKFTTYKEGKKYYSTRNLRNGKVVNYTSEKNRETGIRMREAFSHRFKPRGLAQADIPTRQRVSSLGGKSRRR